MKGRLLDFSINSDQGIISGDDGNRYTFSSVNWKDKKNFPQKGLRVDFEIDGEKATNIYFSFEESQSNLISQNKTRTSSKGITQKFLPGKKVYIIGVVIVGITGCGFGINYIVDLNQANTCRNQTKEAIKNISEEWDDTMSRAANTSRISLQPVISDLQNIKRRVSNNKWHKCAEFCKIALKLGMESDIAQLLDFMGGDDISYHKSVAWSIFSQELSFIDKNGKADHIANSEETAKETLQNVLEAKIDELDEKLKSINPSYVEYQTKYDEIDSKIKKISNQESAVPEVDYSLPYENWEAASERRDAQLEQLRSKSSDLYDKQSALFKQYEDVIEKRSDLLNQKAFIEEDIEIFTNLN
jgi:hypothetical protein